MATRGRSSIRVSPALSVEEAVLLQIHSDWITDNERDRTVRETYKAGMALPQAYTADEEGFVRVALAHLAMNDATTSIRKDPVKGLPRSLHETSILVNKDDPVSVYGSASCIFRESTVEDIIATFFDQESVYMSGNYDRNPHLLERIVLEKRSFNHYISYSRFSVPRPLQDRDGVGSILWKRISPTQALHVVHSTDHPAAPVYPDVLRAEQSRYFRLTQTSARIVTCDFVFKVNMKGLFPKALVKAVIVPSQMFGLWRMQLYRAYLVGLDKLDDSGDDARFLSNLLLDVVRKEKNKDERKKALLTFFYRSAALRDASQRFPWLPALVWAIVENKLKKVKKVTTLDLGLLTVTEAKTIGESFALLLLGSTTFDAATDEWIVTNPTMKALDAELPMFRPFVSQISKHLLETATWGAKTRVVLGAVLSIVDMVSDMNVIRQYFEQGERGAAIAMISMICVNVFFQLVIVAAQNGRKPRGTLALEMLYVVTCIKPGIDALRVIRGGERDPLLLFNAATECGISRATETALEALPGCILQTVMLFRSEKTTKSAIVSVTLSAMFAAYTSASISFDIDTDPTKRKTTPHFYGYIADDKRGSMFFTIFIFSLTQVAAKVLSVAILLMTQSLWLIIWMSTDVLLLFGYKAMQRDLMRWIPIRGEGLKYVIVALVLPVSKVLCDFLGFLHLRHPLDLGGSYFCISVVQSQIGCWVAAFLYFTYGDSSIAPSVIFYFMGIIQAAWVVSGIIFFLTMNRKFCATFYSPTSGRNYVKSNFVEATADSERIKVFDYQEAIWSEHREGVKKWVRDSWPDWNRERPEWFTDAVTARIPADMIPAAVQGE